MKIMKMTTFKRLVTGFQPSNSESGKGGKKAETSDEKKAPPLPSNIILFFLQPKPRGLPAWAFSEGRHSFRETL